MEVVAEAGPVRRERARNQRRNDGIVAAFAGDHQVLVERRLQRARVGDAQHCAAGLDLVGERQPRLYLAGDGEAVVAVESQPEVRGPRPGRDGVLRIGGELLDVSMAVEGVKTAALGQVVGLQRGAVRPRHWSPVGNWQPRPGTRVGIDNPKLEVLVEKGLRVRNAGFHVVNPVRVSHIRNHARVGQRTLLRDRLLLQVRRTAIGKRVLAGVVIEGVAAEKVIGIQHRVLVHGPWVLASGARVQAGLDLPPRWSAGPTGWPFGPIATPNRVGRPLCRVLRSRTSSASGTTSACSPG